MNHLTAIRQAMTKLRLAYDFVQKQPNGKAEALLLLKSAEENMIIARGLLNDKNQKPEDYVYAEWRKYAEMANKRLGDTDPASLAYRGMADHLQHLLEDWSPYGHSLVWKKG